MTFIPTRSGLVLLDSKVASNSAQLDFTSGINDRFDVYEVHYGSIIPATDGTTLNLRTSTDGGSNFDAGASDYRWAYGGNRSASTAWVVGGSTGATSMQLTTGIGNQANEKAYGVVRCYGLRDSGSYKVFESMAPAWDALPDASRFTMIHTRNSTTVVNALRVLCASGNITSGWARLYGVRK